MKYFLRILLALVLAAAVVTGAYYYTHDRTLPGKPKAAVITTVTKPPATEKYAARKLLGRDKKNGFALYKSGSSVILEHNGNEFTYDDWSKVIDTEKPKFFYADFDDDGKKELIIRAVSGEDEDTGELVYELYVLNPKKGKKEDYDVLQITQDTWREVLDEQVTEELSQLKSCPKILQFVMDDKSTTITYNAKTGLAENPAYVGYAKALQNDNGKYMTLFGWTKSKGIFTIEDDKIIAVVDCIANYEETHVIQDLGEIHFEFKITKDNKLTVVPKSMFFKASDKYRASDPTQVAKKNWHFTLNNSFASGKGGTIKWAKYSTKIDRSVFTDTKNLATEETDIKYIKAIDVDQAGITLTAANGYTFADDPVKKGDFSVIINKGKDDEYEISYTATANEDSSQVRINFDKNYAQKVIKTIEINYGTR